MQKNYVNDCESFYFVGIGGVSMSAIASLLLKMGKTVSGCDRCESAFTRKLSEEGIPVVIGDADEDIKNFEVVVYTDAVPENDKSLIAARKNKIPLVARGQFLSMLSDTFRNTIAVAGSHGKSTCTAMLAHIFNLGGQSFACHIGAEDRTFSNAYLGGKTYFITEACEYKKNLLWLRPKIGIVLNSDADHLDCYGTAENVKNTYEQFASQSVCAVRLYGDMQKSEGVTFGFDNRADYYAKNLNGHDGKFSFELYEGKSCLGEIALKVYGKHNVLNAVAAAAAARLSGLSFENIRDGLEKFEGISRRFEYIGRINGVTCIADYAHHPNEIKAVLKTVRQARKGKLFVIFQPHTYSRTKLLFKQFVTVLSNADNLLIYRTYAAREYYDDAGSALTLSRALKRSKYADGIEGICSFVSGAGADDTVLVLGAGDIYDIALTLVDR